jgi:hypothetical protein
MPATIDGPVGMPLITTWTGGDADQLRDSLRMTNESFAAHLGVAVRTVANWRKQPEIIPHPERSARVTPGSTPWQRRRNAAAGLEAAVPLSAGMRNRRD